MDKKTGEKSKTRPRFVKQDQVCIARLRAAGVICLETFKDFPQMGRFTLRDEGGSSSSLQYSSKNVNVTTCGLIVCVKSVFLLRFKWKFQAVLLPSASPSDRKNYRHWQSAEAGAREGLTAAHGGMHGVL